LRHFKGATNLSCAINHAIESCKKDHFDFTLLFSDGFLTWGNVCFLFFFFSFSFLFLFFFFSFSFLDSLFLFVDKQILQADFLDSIGQIESPLHTLSFSDKADFSMLKRIAGKLSGQFFNLKTISAQFVLFF